VKKALRILSCVALVLGVSGAAQALTPEQAAALGRLLDGGEK